MSKSKKFFYLADCQQNTVRRSTSDIKRSVLRIPTDHPIDSNKSKETVDDLQQHPPLMRKKSHFFQVHQRETIDTTPTIEFSPSDEDDELGDSGRQSNPANRRCVSGHHGPVIEELVDGKANSENATGNTIDGRNAQSDTGLNATSDTSLISKRELRRRMARLLLRSCDIYDVDNNLPGDLSRKFSLR